MVGLKRPEDFDVWKLAWELKRRVFALTATLPATSDRRFCDDIRRAARSGPDLVAEGYYRFNPREFHRFLNDAKASLGEVRNQLLHAKDEKFIEIKTSIDPTAFPKLSLVRGGVGEALSGVDLSGGGPIDTEIQSLQTGFNGTHVNHLAYSVGFPSP